MEARVTEHAAIRVRQRGISRRTSAGDQTHHRGSQPQGGQTLEQTLGAHRDLLLKRKTPARLPRWQTEGGVQGTELDQEAIAGTGSP